MPFGVKMEAMETEETWKNLVKFVEETVKMNGNEKDEDEAEMKSGFLVFNPYKAYSLAKQ